VSRGRLRVVQSLPLPSPDPGCASWRCGTCGRMWNGGDGRHTCWTFYVLATFIGAVTAGQIALLTSLLR
jgi:hypothetical protein